jgi:cyclic pyranopterin phosphate synthase
LKWLKQIGINRINISLDTLSKDLFYDLTGKDKLYAVQEGIQQALAEKFKVKINMVVLKGINETEIIRFIQYFSKCSVEVRFIEFMPLCGDKWREDYFFPYDKIIKTIESRYQMTPRLSSGVAQEFFLTDKDGLRTTVGIIAPMTRSFCGDCSRLRLSANGDLWPCLFSTAKVSLLPVLRGDFSAEEREKKLIHAFRRAVQIKPLDRPVGHTEGNTFIRSIGG